MKSHLVENEDYYFDPSGLMVLTEKYHLEKGFCCGNGCRHCPFNYVNVEQPDRDKLLSLRKHEQNQKGT